ncbi:MAG TPA: hypothetical protein PK069_01660 [Methanolinea sp.]|nr:hypothetical protein [Methanolinea sp.]HQK56813.1 hypothetical protein [Methanolinea sp.]
MFSIRFFRIYDIGDEVDLRCLERELAASTPTSRSRFNRVRPASITIAEPPLLVRLQGSTISTPRGTRTLSAMAKVFDFGAISICLCLVDQEAPSTALEEAALHFAAHEGLSPHFERALSELREVLRPVLGERPIDAEFYEEYTIYQADREDPGIDQVAILLGEKGGFSQGVREDTLRHTFSYYPDEKAVLSWNGTILFSPDPLLDLIELIEYAAVQVLELRFYERELSRQMERMYDDIENADRQWWISRSFKYRALMKALMSEQAEVSEVIEDVNNLIKVTEDVYYARVYAAALQVLRSGQWTDSVNRKLATIRETYRMLSDEVNIQHAHFLEWIIILLIAFEIVIFLLPVAGH